MNVNMCLIYLLILWHNYVNDLLSENTKPNTTPISFKRNN